MEHPLLPTNQFLINFLIIKPRPTFQICYFNQNYKNKNGSEQHSQSRNPNTTFFFLNLCLRFRLASLWSEQTAQCVCTCVVEYAASQWCVSAVCCGAVDLLCLQCSVIPNYPLHQLCSTRLLFGIQTTAPGLSLHPPLPCVSSEIISHILSPYPFVSLYIPFPFLLFCFHTHDR